MRNEAGHWQRRQDFCQLQVTPDYKNILMFIENLKMKLGSDNEYMASYDEQTAKIERFDKRIEELALQKRYEEKAKKLECFLGIKTHTALSLLVEIGDFSRFAKGEYLCGSC